MARVPDLEIDDKLKLRMTSAKEIKKIVDTAILIAFDFGVGSASLFPVNFKRTLLCTFHIKACKL